ncbi:hypothetical protein [Sporomusa acidovorans]|uniref:HTH merR-type domain-containing protein n=1 Tax=Sporomusa acidovorans (strain ATCC 49682 / DSM 3132 / Mol) TaxID=1123286 RepID=A0ABZ3IWU4_SPOA4|nr:hypothetical protein [Sporomusa acidovorans]OZC23649.1 hypothetical protein SPACI_05510 [Sporomusa acidovorans DSM 3132]SDE23917.1 hypothetical protein SAMN04488499_101077 [Sporomusa acidovorans]
MSPDEVLEKLQRMGVKISRSTLMRYENQWLIPEPKRGGGGPGGRYTDYPAETVIEAYAAYALMHGDYIYDDNSKKLFADGKEPRLSPKVISISRSVARDMDENKGQESFNSGLFAYTLEKLMDKPIGVAFIQFGIHAWLEAKKRGQILLGIV